MMKRALPCLDENRLVALAEGRVGAAELADVEGHVAACLACRNLLAAALDLQTHEHQTGSADVHAAGARHGHVARGTVVGRYTILNLAGRGAMGEVYAAYDGQLDRKIALKLLLWKGGDARTEARARLLREARALAKLSHPNVVAVHDVGQFGERVFLAMEYVDGVTLRQWLAERPRGRDEILAAFTQAARGLAAAHAVDLVHRDFKPANVMVSRAGAVRVMDFGLARQVAGGAGAGDEGGSGPWGPDTAVALTLTATGAIVGTPRYMSPEQFRAAPTDGRTDQFSFCVALYEALYGAPPFGEGDVRRLVPEVLAGRVRPAPAKSNVPDWLRGVLLRGLSVSPEARWPSMEALAAALLRKRTLTRRRRAMAVGGALLAAGAISTLVHGPRVAPSLCKGGPARLAGAWVVAATDPGREATRRAFLASGAPAAADVWERVATGLDRYASSWLDMYQESCEAAHVRHAQTAALLDLRMACLDERRTALAALTNALAVADRRAVTSAVDAVTALPGLSRCANAKLLEAATEPPRDEATRRRVDDLRNRAARAKAANDTGKREEAGRLERELLAEARRLGYLPLIAEILINISEVFNSGKAGPDVIPLVEEGVWTSLAVAREDLAAEAAIALVAQEGAFGSRVEWAEAWAGLANSLLDRLGSGQELLRSWLLTNQASVAMRRNDARAALELTRRAIALKQEVLAPDHPDVAMSLNTEADALAALGQLNDALRINQRVLTTFDAAYGPASTEVAFTLSNRGEYLVGLGRSSQALGPLRRSLAVWQAQIGPDHPFLGFPLTATGRALLALGRAHEAVPPLERAVRLRDTRDPDPLLAESRFALARALWDARADRERAIALAVAARDAYVTTRETSHLAEVDGWLGAHAAKAKAVRPPPGPVR